MKLKLTLARLESLLMTACDDPRDICGDVSGLGRWGNGDVEFRISKHDEIPYVIGLVRQSLERQLGNEEVA